MIGRKTSSARRRSASRKRHTEALVSDYNALVASAKVMRPDRNLIIKKPRWQDEAWGFHESMGEVWYVTEWLANALSRVRIRAAKITSDGDEPEIVDDGPAADLIDQLCGGVGGQSAMLKSFAVKLTVAGDSYLVGREILGSNQYTWCVVAADVIRVENSGEFSIQVNEGVWDLLPKNSLVVRVWQPDEHFPWLATSPMRPALSTLREIDLYNRRIIAELTSRLAFNGVWLIPSEVSFPVREEYADAADPFVAEIIEVASQAIKNPGSAVAAIPIPLRAPAQYIEAFKHLTFSSEIAQQTIEAREKALERWASMAPAPAEALTGMGSVNHWSGWQIEDAAIKLFITPLMEIICAGITKGYLDPGLHAANSLDSYADEDAVNPDGLVETDGERFIAWYDTSELKEKPDISERAVQLHDRQAITDAALRRTSGFDENDKPSDEERDTQILVKLAGSGMEPTKAYEMLTGTPVPGEADAGATPGPVTDNKLPVSPPGIGLPRTRTDKPVANASLRSVEL